jgi:hypothetical protein
MGWYNSHPIKLKNKLLYMNKTQLKDIVSKKIITLMREWFADKPIIQAVGITIVQTQINRFDGLLDMLTDENGNVNVDALIVNLGNTLEQDYTIDLTTISPYLPNRVLIITKEDIKQVIEELKKG